MVEVEEGQVVGAGRREAKAGVWRDATLNYLAFRGLPDWEV